GIVIQQEMLDPPSDTPSRSWVKGATQRHQFGASPRPFDRWPEQGRDAQKHQFSSVVGERLRETGAEPESDLAAKLAERLPIHAAGLAEGNTQTGGEAA